MNDPQTPTKSNNKKERLKRFRAEWLKLSFSEKLNSGIGIASLFAAVAALFLAISDGKQNDQLERLTNISASVESQLSLLRKDSAAAYIKDSIYYRTQMKEVFDTIHYNYFYEPDLKILKSKLYKEKMRRSIAYCKTILSTLPQNSFLLNNKFVYQYYNELIVHFDGLYFSLTIYGRESNAEMENVRVYNILASTISHLSMIRDTCMPSDSACWNGSISNLRELSDRTLSN